MRVYREEPYRLKWQNRLGFLRLALEHDAEVLPLPVRITHVVSPPLHLGDRRRARCDAGALAALHARVWHQCQGFLDAAVAGREQHADAVDRLVRTGERLLQRYGV